MKGRRFKFPSRAEWLVLAAVVGMNTVCLRAVDQMKGPRGDPIPGPLPDEANRAASPEGFSMVVPPNWSHDPIDGLFMAPMDPMHRRSSALIHARKIGPDPPTDCDGLRRARFQGREAYERMAIHRRWTFDDPAWSEYDLYFRRGEDWYHIRYGIAEERTTLPPMIRRYINTFSLEGDRPGPAPRISAPAPHLFRGPKVLGRSLNAPVAGSLGSRR